MRTLIAPFRIMLGFSDVLAGSIVRPTLYRQMNNWSAV